MSKFRFHVVPRIYSIYEVEADTKEEATKLLREDEGKYTGRDYSDDHLSRTQGEIYLVEEVESK